MANALILKGIVMGLSIAAPVGPIGVLCIRRSLMGGRLAGFVTGFGAATADAFYGCIAGFGLSVISMFLVKERRLLGIIGGAFLCYLGVRTLLSRPASEEAAIQKFSGMFSAYISTLFLTLTNPMTILSFVAIFSGFGVGLSSDFAGTSTFVLGVFLGSTLWWMFLSTAVSLLRDKIDPSWMQWINRISGVIILMFGGYSLTTALLT